MLHYHLPKHVQILRLGLVISLIIVTTYFLPFFALANTLVEANKSSKTIYSDSVFKTVEFQPILPIGNIKNISSPFGKRLDSFTGLLENHQGADYPAAIGTPILATANGTITQAGYNGGYGNFSRD